MSYLECGYWSNNYVQSKTLETFENFNQNIYICSLHHPMNPTIDKETTYNLLKCETFNPLCALLLEPWPF